MLSTWKGSETSESVPWSPTRRRRSFLVRAQFDALDLGGVTQPFEDAVSQAHGFLCAVDVGDDDGELVAAETADHVPIADGLREHVPHMLQERIAQRVAQ